VLHTYTTEVGHNFNRQGAPARWTIRIPDNLSGAKSANVKVDVNTLWTSAVPLTFKLNGVNLQYAPPNIGDNVVFNTRSMSTAADGRNILALLRTGDNILEMSCTGSCFDGVRGQSPHIEVAFPHGSNAPYIPPANQTKPDHKLPGWGPAVLIGNTAPANGATLAGSAVPVDINADGSWTMLSTGKTNPITRISVDLNGQPVTVYDLPAPTVRLSKRLMLDTTKVPNGVYRLSVSAWGADLQPDGSPSVSHSDENIFEDHDNNWLPNYRTITVNNAGGITPPAGSGTGLTANYFNNETLSGAPALTRVDPQVDFFFHSNGPGGGINGNNWSARWTGQARSDQSGPHTFYLDANVGARLWVNGSLIADTWDRDYPQGVVNLTAGQKVNIQLEYYDHDGNGIARLFWSHAAFAKRIVHQYNLYPTMGPATGPTVSLTAPANNALLTGASNLAATASDAAGVQRVEFYYRDPAHTDHPAPGTLIGQDTSAPYAVSWNSPSVPNGLYEIRAIAANNNGGATVSNVVQVMVQNAGTGGGDTTAPAVGGIAVSPLHASSATVVFNTNEPAAVLVEYGLTTSYGAMVQDAALRTTHGLALTGLTPGTLYHYRLHATDAVGNMAMTGDNTFTTRAGPAAKPGDMNGDGVVELTDLSLFLPRWNSADALADFNDSGLVDVADLSILLSNWTPSVPSARVFAAASPAQRHSASLRLAPRARGSYADPLTVDVFLDSPLPVNGVQASILFPADKLALDAVDTAGSAFAIGAREDRALGAVVLARGHLQPLSGRLKVATLVFRSFAGVPDDGGSVNPHHGAQSRFQGAAVFPVKFAQNSMALKADDAANILRRAQGLEISDRPGSRVMLSPHSADGVNDQIIFEDDAVEVVVLDVNGKRVFQAESAGGAAIAWPGTDNSGRPLPSGAYIAKVRSADGSQRYQTLTLVK